MESGSIGVALSGGGARGFAHAGALKAMHAMGIRPSMLAGCSAGSVVAVMTAAGLMPEEILELFSSVKFTDFCELSVPKNGFFKMDGFCKFLKKNIPYANLEDLPVPTTVVATDIGRGEAVYFDRGPLVERVAASCSMPIVFQPMKVDGRHLVDGGVLHNLPAAPLRGKCDTVIGVNCSPPANNEEYKDTILDIAQRSYSLMAKTNAVYDSRLCDIVIETPAIAQYRVFDLSGIRDVYDNGYTSAMTTLATHGYPMRPRERD